MNRDQEHHGARTRAARLGVGLAVAATSVLGIAGHTGVDAAPRTESTVIADAAAGAVDSLERWQDSQNPIDYVTFVQHRDRAAALSEADLEIAPGSLRDAWEDVSLAKQEAVLHALSQLGVPYRYLASEPGVGFDCSGLTIWAFGEAGTELARVSRDQIDDAAAVDESDAEAGDLVYYPGHISIFLGADMMVHSPNSGSRVEITDLPERSLRFGDAIGDRAGDATDGSLVDRALAVAE